MLVISVPSRLKLFALALLVSIPLIGFEVVIISSASAGSWEWPYRSIAYWVITFSLICIPLVVWITAVKSWAFNLCGILIGLWVLISFWITFHMSNPQLGFFTLLLLCVFFGLLLFIKYELSRSYINPDLPWYQGMPKPIPGLKCRLGGSQSEEIDLDVCRIDQDGAFLFSSKQGVQGTDVFNSLLNGKKLSTQFQFRTHQVECECRPIVSLSQGPGVGVQFIQVSDDRYKEIGDFVELLRGEGYV